MSKDDFAEIEKEIEDASDNLISELIKLRNGVDLSNPSELITIAATITLNAATLEEINFSDLTNEEKFEISFHILTNLYNEMLEAELIPNTLKLQIDELLNACEDLKQKILTAIIIYDTTAKVTNLPSFKHVKKSGLKALRKIKKIKFKL